MHVNGKPIPTVGLSLAMDHEKKLVMVYRTHFEGSGIHNSNSGLQVTFDMYLAGYSMLRFDLSPGLAATEGHTSHPDNGNFRIEAYFDKELPDAITCLLYLEYDDSVRIDFSRKVVRNFF
jgi:hypothetical protein